ncbi:uncharacterized protein HMPREF1541_00119 [Cyphellophora europaea CBS 101466]|uniref:Uncharacterized protein n=1 Tax=Cyphellophora europaea (strain CBS 101466) TaxID=1220924 RepID=W2SB68_CYPE1|nr:uncharacterized protein HMPREF1541_00119 [Cyphellophora europaea CBS 101466]ETN45937.1 hypothetical protein HMPREF1541_00119 [Cyphellophora europaea CBS 101466]
MAVPLVLLTSYTLLLHLLYATCVTAGCRNPTPSYIAAPLVKTDPLLQVAFSTLTHKIALVTEEAEFEATSFSVSLTSETEDLWSYHHTAEKLDPDRPGANPVNGDTFYRVASITKMFTTHALLQQYAAGNISLEDPITKYLPELKNGPPPTEGGIDWDGITLRSLASQISGIPRDWSQGEVGNASHPGLPPPNNPHLPGCFEYSNYSRPCTTKDLWLDLHRHRPLFSPNLTPSYSNTAFELLGLVVANASGLSYVDYVTTHILDHYFPSPSGATFSVPPDEQAALTPAGAWYWAVDLGIHIPAGGLYATANGLSAYLRHIVSQYKFADFGGPNVNMFMPQGYNFGMNSAYGLTWEIFRTARILEGGRPVTFYTKGGGHPGYITIIIAVPEYNLGITILCAGDRAATVLDRIREVVTAEIVRAADAVSQRYTKREYAGYYLFESRLDGDGGEVGGEETKLNSSLTLEYTAARGLHLKSCISNGTDMLASLGEIFNEGPGQPLALQLIPTGQYASVAPIPEGEIWRGIAWQAKKDDKVWSDFCINNVDSPQYDGRPLLQVVFREGHDVAELTGLRVRLRKVRDPVREAQEDDSGQRLVIQDQA